MIFEAVFGILFGVIAGLLEFIPLAGPLAVAVIVAVISSFYSVSMALGVLVFLAILRVIHDYAIYPRIIGQGRASELLFSGRVMSADEGERWGFHNRLVEPDRLLEEARSVAASLAAGPTFAHGITKTQLNTEWNVSLETAIEMEAQAQAICMGTNDFRRAFEAFAEGHRTPEFKGD